MENEEKIPINLSLGIKMWLKGFESFTLGPGDIRLIKSLISTQNLTNTSKDLGYSYKYGWSKLQTIKKKSGRPVVITSKGGYGGGGNVQVTNWGKYLVQMFDMAQNELTNSISKINKQLKEIKFIDEEISK